VYLTGDTVLTDTVRDVLAKHQPDVCIVPGGGARLDLGGPVLMDLDELVEFIELAPGRVIINHIGALNHCPIRFDDIRQRLAEDQQERVHLVADGESVELLA
jgi:L-ascorbate metabolism protein UlaG (beta-lactamase superfamily)